MRGAAAVHLLVCTAAWFVGCKSVEPISRRDARPTYGAESKVESSEDRDSLPVHEVASGDGTIHLSVAASKPPRLEPIGDGDGDHALHIDVPEGTIDCVIYGERLNAGAAVERRLRDLAAVRGGSYAVDRVEASAVVGRPYLHAIAIAQGVEGGSRTRSVLHVAVGAAQFETFACQATGLGAQESFLRTYRSALRTLRTPDTEPPPDLSYHAVSRITSSETKQEGFIDDFVYDRMDGSTSRQRFRSRLAPTPDGNVGVHDEVLAELSAEGRVVLGHYVGSNANGVVYRLQMEIVDHAPPTYKVNGEALGDAFASSFVVDGGLRDVHAEAEELRRILREAPRAPLPLRFYDPSANRSEATTLQIRMREQAVDRSNATITIGSATRPAELSGSGRLVVAPMLVDGVLADENLVWSSGSLLRHEAPAPSR